MESRVQTLPAVKRAVLTGIRENLCRAVMCVLEPPEEEKCSLGRTARVWGMQFGEEFHEQIWLSYQVHRKVTGANSIIFQSNRHASH